MKLQSLITVALICNFLGLATQASCAYDIEHSEPHALLQYFDNAVTSNDTIFIETILTKASHKLFSDPDIFDIIVQSNNSDILQQCINHGFDINKTIGRKYLLRTAIEKQSENIVRYALEHGAKVNIKNRFYSLLVAAAENDNVHITELLINHGADVNEGIPIEASAYRSNNAPALEGAMLSMKPKQINYLIEHGAKHASLVSFALDRSVKTNIATLQALLNDTQEQDIKIWDWDSHPLRVSGELIKQLLVRNDSTATTIQYLIGSDDYAERKRLATLLVSEQKQFEQNILNQDTDFISFLKQLYHLIAFTTLSTVDVTWSISGALIITVFTVFFLTKVLILHAEGRISTCLKGLLASAAYILQLATSCFCFFYQHILHIYNYDDWPEKKLTYWKNSHWDYFNLRDMGSKLLSMGKTIVTSSTTYLLASLATLGYAMYKLDPVLRDKAVLYYSILTSLYLLHSVVCNTARLNTANHLLHETTFGSDTTNVPQLGDIVMDYVGGDLMN